MQSARQATLDSAKQPVGKERPRADETGRQRASVSSHRSRRRVARSPGRRRRPDPQQIGHIRLGIDDSYTSVPGFSENRLALVLDQDTDNFRRQWAGMQASRKPGETLANYQEVRIRHFHRTLDTYLAPA